MSFTDFNPLPQLKCRLSITLGNKSFESIEEKEKMVTNIILFSHGFLQIYHEKMNHLSPIDIAVCKCFQFGHK